MHQYYSFIARIIIIFRLKAFNRKYFELYEMRLAWFFKKFCSEKKPILKNESLWYSERRERMWKLRNWKRQQTFGAHIWVVFPRTGKMSKICHNFYRTQVNLGSDSWVRMSVSEWATFVDLTDVTLADDDTNSILTDNAKRAIQGNEAMQVM